MIPRDPDSAAPPPEPESSAADWATEESVAEPTRGRSTDAAGAANADSAATTTPTASTATTPAASPATPTPAPPPAQPAEPIVGSWLASSQGLIPRDAGTERQQHGGQSGAAPGSDLDFAGTRVYPRPQQPAEDWGWQQTPDAGGRTAVPSVPSVEARTAATTGWVPFDPEADARAARPYGDQVAAQQPYAVRPGRVEDDPYGRQSIYGETAAGSGAVPVAKPRAGGGRPAESRYDQRFDPAYAYGYEFRERRGVPWRRLLVSFLLGLILATLVAAGAIYAYEQQYANRILPNVHVGAVDVSGLTRDAAYERLADAYKGYGEGSIQVALAGATTEIPYADIDRHIDIDALLDEAFGVGRGPFLTDRLLGELRAATKGVSLQPTVIVDAGKLHARIHSIAAAAESNAVDAGAVVTGDGFATTPSSTGQSVDEGTVAADLAAQLSAIDAPQTVQVALTATPILPAVTDASAQVATKQATLMQNDIVLTDGPDSWTIPAATVHQWLSFTIINNRVRIAIDTKGVLAELTPLAKKIDRAAVNATVKLQGTKIVFDRPSVDGRTFDASKTTTAVVNALRNRALGSLAVNAPIPPVLALVKPALTTDQAKAAVPLMKQISSWTTNYQPSVRNGNGANIRIPTATINGYVVAPGETFSFWKAVGPVTRDLGYTDGGAIIDGHTEPQGALGGGICSCSTTLFNAALRAGFKMGDRLNHFYYITRYPLGLDATVFISASGQAQDMSWTNDSDYPVVIQGINGPAFVRFALYSVPNGRTTAFSTPTVKNYTRAHTETRVDKTIPRGTTKQIEYATDGQDVWVTRTVKDKSGAVIHKETFYSHYATITGIILTNP